MSEIVGMAIDGTNNFVFTYYDDETVTAGTSKNLSERRQPSRYILPGGRKPEDIVGMGIDGGNNFVFAWYRDRTVSAGTSRNLAQFRDPVPYRLPQGESPEDIVGMGIDGTNNNVVAWYRDGRVSMGTSRHLFERREPAEYILPPSLTPDDIVGMGVDGFLQGHNIEKDLIEFAGDELVGRLTDDEDNLWETRLENIGNIIENIIFGSRESLCFAWYRNGLVSAGRSTNLDEMRHPYRYTR